MYRKTQISYSMQIGNDRIGALRVANQSARGKTTMRVFFALLVAMMVFEGGGRLCHAQVGTLPSTADCSMGTLTERVAALNSRCCRGGGGNSACTCTIDCSSVLFPLLDDCRALLDVLLDMDDGTRDGVAGQLDTLHAQCLAIPELDVLARLKEMRDAGICPNEALNGVAQTTVTAAPCADSGEVACDALVIAGLQCKDATMVTNCKDMCGLCDGHRRAQAIKQRCSDAEFSAGATVIDEACCDDGQCQGPPTTCDAKCAIAYNDFFEQCDAKLEQNVAAADMSKYTDLHSTCSTQLPVEPLLRAVIACSCFELPSATTTGGISLIDLGNTEPLRTRAVDVWLTPPAEYTISLDITPNEIYDDYTSIIHFSEADENEGAPYIPTGADGDRVPALWFRPSSTTLYFDYTRDGARVQSLDCSPMQPLPVGMMSRVQIDMFHGSITLKVNCVEVCSLETPPHAPARTKVYAGDPWCEHPSIHET
eukprot:COSAG02_NODE_2044_length_10022_cov_81.942558_7_plen_481_part_00